MDALLLVALSPYFLEFLSASEPAARFIERLAGANLIVYSVGVVIAGISWFLLHKRLQSLFAGEFGATE